MKLFDYECFTTFWDDFTIADSLKHGQIAAIKDTYKRAFKEWKHDYKYLTELVMVLNHKIWQWYDGEKWENGKSTDIARVYSKLWEEARDYAETHLKDEELSYYFRITD